MMNYIKKHYKIITGVLVIIIIAVVWYARSQNSGGNTTVVTVGTVTQKVTVIGKVKPAHNVNLAFERSGTLTHVYADIGAHVTAGQVLATLDSSDTYASVQQAQANVAVESAKLEDLKAGSRPEDIAVSEVALTNAQIALTDAQNNMQAKLLDSRAKADDAIHNSIDQFFSNPRTNNPQISVMVNDTQVKNDINQSRAIVEITLSTWPDIQSNLVVQTGDVVSRLVSLEAFVDKVANIVNALSSTSNTPQTTIDAYKASVSAARTNIVTAINNLTTVNGQLNTAQSAVSLAQSNLTLKKAGNTSATISAQQAKVLQMQAQLASANANLAKTSIRSPLSGIVTKQDAKAGQIASAGVALMSVISDTNLEIEANVSEVSIGKVVVGDKVNITMDAFSGTIFDGTVTYIEPAETLVDGVVNFKVTVVFDKAYPEIKTGLTANLDIKTAQKDMVVRIPQYAVKKTTDGSFVSLKVGKVFVQTRVETGLSGNDGFVEVLSGVKEGDVIELVNSH